MLKEALVLAEQPRGETGLGLGAAQRRRENQEQRCQPPLAVCGLPSRDARPTISFPPRIGSDSQSLPILTTQWAGVFPLPGIVGFT